MQSPDAQPEPLPAGELPGEGPGTMLGHYRIVEAIGEGGFGTVFRAEQMHPVQREVALKIIKLGMDTRQIVARFEAERQALARMDHPSIAKVFDAGATETGRPYFVMELVAGVPITEYCDREELPTPERIALFRQVCLAVQHAHQKGVLHRDLKPSNILVTVVDGEPRPKVIDFGIAKALEKPLTDSSLATEAFQVMGTPEYMPPEQAAAQDVDTRADVYSLGIVLYELLTGTPPFARSKGGLNDLSELLYNIQEVTPPKPSTRVSELGGEIERVARSHGTPTSSFTRTLRGDLDWIVLRALEKDRERRYATALELADDLTRHLRNEPVLASPPSKTYRLKKFVRRNRLAVGAGAVVAATLLVASIGLALLYSRSVASEARATRQAETSRRALDFMIAMFEVSDPSQARGETVTAREILDRGADRIDRELADQPEIRSELMAAMAEVYTGLGLYDRAEELLESAAATRRELLGVENPEALRLSTALGVVLTRQSRFAEAETLLRESVARLRGVLGPEHPATLDGLLALSQLLHRRNAYDEAETLAREALDTARRTLGDEHELALAAVNVLGGLYQDTARFEEAEPLCLEGLETRRRTLGEDHPETLIALADVAELYKLMGRFEEAEALFTQARENVRRVLGDEHPDFLLYRAKGALLLFDQNRLEEAEAVYREVLEVQRRTLGDDHLDTLTSLNSLGTALRGLGRPAEAEEYLLESYEGLRRLLGERHERTLTISGNISMLHLATGDLDEAETWARRVYEGSKELHGEDHPLTLMRLENLSNVFYKQGDEAGAAEILHDVLAGRRRSLGDEHPYVTRTLVNLSVVRGSLRDEEGAAAVREELLQRSLAGVGFDYPAVAEEIQQLTESLYLAGEYERAAESIAEVLRIRLATLGPEHPLTLKARNIGLFVAVKGERWDECDALGPDCYEEHARILGTADPKTIECLNLLVESCERRSDEAGAATWRAKLTGPGG